MSEIERRNDRARARAQKAGRDTYTREVVDHWPACVVCADSIRPRPFRDGRYCACDGVRWEFDGVIGRSPRRVVDTRP